MGTLTSRTRPPTVVVATLALLAALSFGASAHAASTQPRVFDVIGYTAYLTPDLTAGTVTGVESIELTITANGAAQLEFDVGGLVIDEVNMRGKAVFFSVANKKLTITLPVPARSGKRLKVTVRYHGSPRHGLEFHPEAAQLYTVFSTSEWLVTIDVPEERASLDLSVVLPVGYRAIGNGPMLSRRKTGPDKIVYRWLQREPVPSFAYGFVAGKLNHLESTANGIRLGFLTRTLTDEQTLRLFANSSDMLAFFAERSGVAYSGKYDQALVTETIGQEAAGYALLSEAYGRSTLAGTDSEELIAHEIAHQWWGIGTTCRTWREFWLNEGFATFMAAAYIQHRFGDAQYAVAVDRWKTRLDKLQAEGKDHALVYEHWDKPSRDDRAVVYQKGAYVLHLLRQDLGEAAFWKGIRAYSRQFANTSVTTIDFKGAMERSSGRSLDEFFSRWVTR